MVDNAVLQRFRASLVDDQELLQEIDRRWGVGAARRLKP